MRDPNGNPIVIGGQQDASEFNSLFLETVENALSIENQGTVPSTHAASISSTPSRLSSSIDTALSPAPSVAPANAIKQMFTATFRQHLEILDDGAASASGPIKPATVETISLVVDATGESERDLYCGLDDYTLTKIDYCVENQSPNVENREPEQQPHLVQAVKSVWFTRFAPVLTIYLQRVRFNRITYDAEKVNTRYMFESEIAIDRYLEQNRAVSEDLRKKVKRIRSAARNTNDLLRCIADGPRDDLASSNVPSEKAASGVTQPSSGLHEMQNCIDRTRRRLLASVRDSVSCTEEVFLVPGLGSKEIGLAQEVLDLIAKHDQMQISILKEQALSLSENERSAYDLLDRIRYRLHSVLVHDGDPSSGHYWTFIRNIASSSESDRWLKFNDMVVTPLSEAGMMYVSRGGVGRASAYCLIYTLASEGERLPSTLLKRDQDAMDIDVHIAQTPAVSYVLAKEAQSLLPSYRQEEVTLTNEAFLAEVKCYTDERDAENRARKAKDVVEDALNSLRDSKELLSTASTASGVPGLTCGVRSQAEFALALGRLQEAIVFALATSWAVHMADDPDDSSKRDFLKYLGSRSHSLAQFPELGANKASGSPESVARSCESPVSMLIERIGHVLRSVDTEFPVNVADQFSKLLPRKEVLHGLTAALTGSQRFVDLEDKLSELETHYQFSIMATKLMTHAMDFWLKNKWLDAISLWRLAIEQDVSNYVDATCDDQMRARAEIFRSTPAMSRNRRDAEARDLVPALLTAACKGLAIDAASPVVRSDTNAHVRKMSNVFRKRANALKTHALMTSQAQDPSVAFAPAILACDSFLAQDGKDDVSGGQEKAEQDAKDLWASLCLEALAVPDEDAASRFEQTRDLLYYRLNHKSV
jgi:Ubiquitin carboxyl-terminal hydrolase